MNKKIQRGVTVKFTYDGSTEEGIFVCLENGRALVQVAPGKRISVAKSTVRLVNTTDRQTELGQIHR